MMVLTGGSVLLESRPDDISIDMSQLSQRHQQQQQFFDEQVTQHFMSDTTTAILSSTGQLYPTKSRDYGKYRINNRRAWCDIQATG